MGIRDWKGGPESVLLISNDLDTSQSRQSNPQSLIPNPFHPMPDFVRICRVSDIPDGGKAVFEAGDRFVAVFHVGGRFYALDDCCTHDGGPLGEGRLEGFTIACPRHGAKFDIRDGRVLSMPAVSDTPSYAVKVEGDEVFREADGVKKLSVESCQLSVRSPGSRDFPRSAQQQLATGNWQLATDN